MARMSGTGAVWSSAGAQSLALILHRLSGSFGPLMPDLVLTLRLCYMPCPIMQPQNTHHHSTQSSHTHRAKDFTLPPQPCPVHGEIRGVSRTAYVWYSTLAVSVLEPVIGCGMCLPYKSYTNTQSSLHQASMPDSLWNTGLSL